MSHIHDHAAMDTSSRSVMHQEQPSGSVSSGHGLQMMMMAMTFHGGYKESILFDAWTTKTVGAFVGSWFLVFFLGVFYEGLKTFRDVISQRNSCDLCSAGQDRARPFPPSDEQQSSSNDLIPSISNPNLQSHRARLLSLPHLIQTLLHILQMTVSYFLMLIAMTFNTYLFLAVVFGAGFGHFLFGWRRSSIIDHNEHCH